MKKPQSIGWWWCREGKNHLILEFSSSRYEALCNSHWLPALTFPLLAWTEEDKEAGYCETCLKGVAATSFALAHPGRETTLANLTKVVKIR